MMDPQIIHLPQDSIESLKRTDALNAAAPENDAWLSFKKSSETCYVLGHLARRFHGGPKLDQLKYEQGSAKLLAMIGAIIQKEGLTADVKISVCALLPFGEYVNRDQFASEFRKEAKNYYFRGQKINLDVEKFKVLPEGCGFIANIMRHRSETWLASRTIVVLMCGHRNTSLIVFEKGALSEKSQTTELGFVRMVESVVQRTSLNEADAITKSIFRAGVDISAKNPELRLLIRAYEQKNFEQEAQQIADVVESARQEYWILLKDWLKSASPKELDELIIAGGAAHYLKDELDQFFAWAEPAWSTGIVPDQMQKMFSQFSDDSLLSRFRDVYALHAGVYQKSQTPVTSSS